jgi:hypothetical protein
MKAIAVVTMTFLPATFVSVSASFTASKLSSQTDTVMLLQSIFSMSFFHFEPPSDATGASFVLSDKFWMYWVVAAPLSVATLTAWFLWEARLKKGSGRV